MSEPTPDNNDVPSGPKLAQPPTGPAVTDSVTAVNQHVLGGTPAMAMGNNMQLEANSVQNLNKMDEPIIPPIEMPDNLE